MTNKQKGILESFLAPKGGYDFKYEIFNDKISSGSICKFTLDRQVSPILNCLEFQELAEELKISADKLNIYLKRDEDVGYIMILERFDLDD